MTADLQGHKHQALVHDHGHVQSHAPLQGRFWQTGGAPRRPAQGTITPIRRWIMRTVRM
jgi:hypothetical protein